VDLAQIYYYRTRDRRGYDIYYLNFLAGTLRSTMVTGDPEHVWLHSTWKTIDPAYPWFGADPPRATV
jgi:5-deoxy-glucuronate isomerase